MSYHVLLGRRAEKEIRELPPEALKRVDARLQYLASSRRPQGSVRLKGKDSEGELQAAGHRVIVS